MFSLCFVPSEYAEDAALLMFRMGMDPDDLAGEASVSSQDDQDTQPSLVSSRSVDTLEEMETIRNDNNHENNNHEVENNEKNEKEAASTSKPKKKDGPTIRHYKEIVICPDCDQRIPRNKISRHRKEHHTEESIKCPTCEKTFKRKEKLRDHICRK